MSWEEDWPIIGERVFEATDYPYGKPVITYQKPNVGKKSILLEPATSDDFSSEKLGLQWQWNANGKKEWYELTDQVLHLKAIAYPQELPYGDQPNLLLQKWPAPEFQCTYHVNLSHMEVGDVAGVISMGMSYGLIALEKMDTGIQVSFLIGKQFFEGSLVSKTIEEKTILEVLPAETKELSVVYSVKQIGRRDLNEKEKDFPKEQVSISYTSDQIEGFTYKEAGRMIAEPGRWVGTKNGLFCRSNKEASKGYLEVTKVSYER